jgi:hypothetical protein
VASRPSEDVLAVYDAHGLRGNYLWRVMGCGGLESGETPLVTQFEIGIRRRPKAPVTRRRVLEVCMPAARREPIYSARSHCDSPLRIYANGCVAYHWTG